METVKISFHSYKGGSCRSTTCFNTIPYLVDVLGATPQRPIILVDADLDSMGMTLLLTEKTENLFKGMSAKGVFNGTDTPSKSNIKAFTNFEDNAYYNRFIPVGDRFGKEKGTVRFLGVDKEETGSNSNTSTSVDTTALEEVFNPLTKAKSDEFLGAAAIIFDCASGIQHWASMAIKVSNVVVVCLRPSMQFRTSTVYYLKEKFPVIRRAGSMGKCRVVVLPTAVPGEEVITSRTVGELRQDAQESITHHCNQIRSFSWQPYHEFELCDDMISGNFFGIPEVQRFKLAEGIIYGGAESEMSVDERNAHASYKRLAEVIKG